MRKKDKKEITAKTAVKAIITGYISYGILLGFIMMVVLFGVNFCLNLVIVKNPILLTVVISFISVIIVYYILHFICRLSVYDLFKKCKTNPKNLSKIISRMNLFVIICIIINVILSISLLLINFYNEEQAIELATYKYSTIHSEQFTAMLENEMRIDFYKEKVNKTVYTIIMELGIVVSWLSVIPLQKKYILEYNKF